jgi:serine/threonine-protein kinase RsbW
MTQDRTAGGKGFTVDYDSSLASVDAAEEAILRFAQELGVDEEEQYRFGMAVREAMVNAVVHGNRYHEDRKVRFDVAHEPVEVPDPLAEENLLRQSGRGILLIRAFVDEFAIQKRAPRGTEVTLVKYLPAATPTAH